VTRRLALVAALVLMAVQAVSAETVLILPFFNLGKSTSIGWIGDSISETILESLAAEGLVVVPPETRDEMLRQMNIRRYAVLTRASVMELAVNADAETVLYGEVELLPSTNANSKGNLRLSARLFDVRRVKRRGEFSLTGALEDLSSLQSTLAWQVLASVMPNHSMSQEEYRRSHPPIRIDALESYVRGLLATSNDQKHRLFTNAVRLEAGFSQPCYQLGKLNFFASKNYRAAAEWFQKVTPADRHYREALFYLGLSRYQTGDFQGAADVLRKVADAVPLPEVWNNLGAVLLRTGDASAVACFQKAIEINPGDPDYYFNLGYALWRKADFTGAADNLRATLARKPDDEAATVLLGRSLKESGPRPGDVRTEAMERLKTEYNDSAWMALKAMLAPKAP
jgi:tetratricopeptide (TPR) repeat protein